MSSKHDSPGRGSAEAAADRLAARAGVPRLARGRRSAEAAVAHAAGAKRELGAADGQARLQRRLSEGRSRGGGSRGQQRALRRAGAGAAGLNAHDRGTGRHCARSFAPKPRRTP